MPQHYGDDTLDLMIGRMQKANDPDQVGKVSLRVHELKDLNSEGLVHRERIRNIVDGGENGLRELIGGDMRGDENMIPAANLMLSGLTRLAQKTNKLPDIRPATSTQDSDSARTAANRRSRIIAAYDEAANLKMQQMQVARWVPGYGFTPFTVESRDNLAGDPYPHASVRDPFTCYPSQWTLDQQPKDIAFVHVMGARELISRFPEHEAAIRSLASGTSGGSDTSSVSQDHTGWANQKGSGIEVYEYINVDGTWWVIPSVKRLLAFVPNPLKNRPPFYVAKRATFNKLRGQYDHVVGLMASVARLNLLSIIATEDAVFAETNIAGELMQGDQYRRGRHAVNYLAPGTQVDRMTSRVPFEVFQQIDRLERQLRLTAGYPQQDDGQSPTSWATGRGLEELAAGVGNEVQEYFGVYEDTYKNLDSIRMEYDQAAHGSRRKEMHGVLKGAAFAEKYTPRSAIDGNFLSRREYGAMAELDNPTKVVSLLNWMQAEIIDSDTVRENIDGLDDHERIKERVEQERVERLMFQFLGARAEQGDVAAMEAIIGMMRDGETKDLMEQVFIPEEQELAAQQAGPQGPEGGGVPPDVQTVLARMTQEGPTAGVQTVGRV